MKPVSKERKRRAEKSEDRRFVRRNETGVLISEGAIRKGRPPKTPSPGERVSLGLKVTAEIKARLDRAAQTTGRTQSQEAEFRLESTFNRQDLLSEVLTLAYGKEAAGLLMLIGLVMNEARILQHDFASYLENMRQQPEKWADFCKEMEDNLGRPLDVAPFKKPWTELSYDDVFHTVVALLNAARPKHLPFSERVQRRGVERAREIVKELHGGPSHDVGARFNPTYREQLETVRSLLGPLVDRMEVPEGE